VIVAKLVLLLVQVPPVAGVKFIVLFIHTKDAPVKIGLATMSTFGVVVLQVVILLTQMKVTEPAVTPVITPPLVTVALPVLELVQDTPVVGVNWPVPPTQTDVGAVTTGFEFIVTVKLSSSEHPPVVGVRVKI